MKPSNHPHVQLISGFGQANRFLAELKRRPELLSMLREENFDLAELTALGEQLGFQFDGSALQHAFRLDFQLRLAVHKVAGCNSAEHDD